MCICTASVKEKYCTHSFSGLIKCVLKLLPIDEASISNSKYELFLETWLEFQQTPAASKARCFNNLHIFHFTLSVLSLPKHLSPHAANPFWCWKALIYSKDLPFLLKCLSQVSCLHDYPSNHCSVVLFNFKLLIDMMNPFFWGENLQKKVNIARKSKHFVGCDSAWKRPVNVFWFQHWLDNLIGLHSYFSCVNCLHWELVFYCCRICSSLTERG